MHLDEYNKIKDLSYDEYCDYLKDKYGIVRDDYMTPDFVKKRNYSRTKDGLLTHHIMEKDGILLCNTDIAPDFPYEWQTREYLCYCNYLEHLLLHIKIGRMFCGTNFIIQELNDFYSHAPIPDYWKLKCALKVIKDEIVYLAIMENHIDSLNGKYSINILNENYCKSNYYNNIPELSRLQRSIESLKNNAKIYEKLNVLMSKSINGTDDISRYIAIRNAIITQGEKDIQNYKTRLNIQMVIAVLKTQGYDVNEEELTSYIL